MSEPAPEHFVSAFTALDNQTQKNIAKQLAQSNPGLFDFDRLTRRLVWLGLFALLLTIVIGAFVLINNSFGVDIRTTTGSGASKVTSTTHPDVSAAWAAITAVITGIVGVFVPSPTSRTGNPTS